MQFFMTRSFDHAWYYETRSLLMVVAIGVVCYYAIAKKDYRYLAMAVSGVVFQALMETLLQALGSRGADYSLSIFGFTFHPAVRVVFQGLTEGAILSVMGFWFADLCFFSRKQKPSWLPYLLVCWQIIYLAIFVGWATQHELITSPRPMFSWRFYLLTGTIVATLAWVYFLGREAWYFLGSFYLGLLVYIVLTFEPLDLLGARYIAVSKDGEAAPLHWRVILMAYSHLFEVAGGKIHYVVVPFALGLLTPRGGNRGAIPVPGPHG